MSPSLGKDCACNSSGSPYLVVFRYFYAISFLSLTHSSLASTLSISGVESTTFPLLQTGNSRTGTERSKPSEVFWFPVQRRVKNSNAHKGLGLASLQRLRTHSVAANHLGCPEPRACVSTPRDAFFCYSCSWIWYTFLLNKGVVPLHLPHRQREVLASLHCGFLPLTFWPWPSIHSSSTAMLSLFAWAVAQGQAHGHLPCLHWHHWWCDTTLAWLCPHTTAKFDDPSSNLLLSPCEPQEQWEELYATPRYFSSPQTSTILRMP